MSLANYVEKLGFNDIYINRIQHASQPSYTCFSYWFDISQDDTIENFHVSPLPRGTPINEIGYATSLYPISSSSSGFRIGTFPPFSSILAYTKTAQMRKRSGTCHHIEVRHESFQSYHLWDISNPITKSVLSFQEASSSSVYGNQRVAQDDPEQRDDPIVEVITPEVYNEPRNPFHGSGHDH
ncbi:predicted protein [Arabidopsis lyrata subsp. lyrata]|uniref:Predicted protein n=1 Tax=Arabidopsis lyrata subsp. lyrata TaxID=81972 RepID=D7KST4_ARALL|nr:predicted protein [Arabidopsis lyrata subsp. lyrata]